MNKKAIILIFVVSLVACNKKNECEAELISDCVSTKELNPVCGCDNVTYGNPGMAKCNSIDDYTFGTCSDINRQLKGEWEFLGFLSEGAEFGNAKKVHPHDINIKFTDDVIDKLFQFRGKSVINGLSGSYITNNKSLVFREVISTEIAGSPEQTKYEEKYIKALTNSGLLIYEIDENNLTISIGDLFFFKPIDALIYKRKK